MKLPTYNSTGSINMYGVMDASFQEYMDMGMNVIEELTNVLELLISDEVNEDYLKWRSEVEIALIEKYQTEENRKQTPGYTIPANYALAYRIYWALTYFRINLKNDDVKSLDIMILENEIEKLRNPKSLIGFCDFPLPIQSGDVVRISKGTLIRTTKATGEKHAGKTYNVTIHRVGNGYYGVDKVHNPYIVWAGAGKYWHEADMKDVELVSKKGHSQLPLA